MRSNLSSGFLKLFLKLSPFRKEELSLPFFPSCHTRPAGDGAARVGLSILCQALAIASCHTLSNITDCRLLPHHYARGDPQDMVGRGWVSNADLHGTKSNVLVRDQGTQKRNPSTICHSSTGAQLLLVFIPHCWRMLRNALWAVPTCKRMRSLLLKSTESRDVTPPNRDGLCFVEPKYQLWG